MTQDAALRGMATLRIISGCLEILAALAFLRFGKVETALRLNALLGLIGPLVFVLVGVLGIVAVAVKLPPLRIACLTLGTILVLVGTKI